MSLNSFELLGFPLNLYLSGKLHVNTISTSICATYLQILKNGDNFLLKGEWFTWDKCLPQKAGGRGGVSALH